VILAASTGGPQAVETVLAGLPASLDAALLVALHMPAAFTPAYTRRLDGACRLQVGEATDGARLERGQVRVIPGGKQATLFRLGHHLHLRLRAGTRNEPYAPSADVVMSSAAQVVGSGAVGVVLTGMGGDGRRGLEAIRAAGGFTLAESRESALIFGMPAEALRSGAASAALPLEQMPGALVARCGLRILPPDGRERAPSAD
jgi:two-component system chemotaxis response regulator CheB